MCDECSLVLQSVAAEKLFK